MKANKLLLGSLIVWSRCTAGDAFVPAYVNPSPPGLVITAFPAEGPSIAMALPPDLRASSRILAFSPDGNSLFAQSGEIRASSSLIRIRLDPIQLEEVPGAEGLGVVRCLTVSQVNGMIRAIVVRQQTPPTNCEALDLDPGSGEIKTLGHLPCDGLGALSPVSDQVVRYADQRLEVVDLHTGNHRPILKMAEPMFRIPQVAWSPNGQWIALTANGRLEAIEVDNPPCRKSLGKAEGVAVWSPDSMQLLVAGSQFSCIATLYFESLKIVNLATQKQTWIESAHCGVSAGYFGWLSGVTIKSAARPTP